ncbi:MAG: dephospho-CoA kinase [Pseudazoarcus pumilus]|nr:dephospho-CoA kinase [Pseudazoarcus pumilus]
MTARERPFIVGLTGGIGSGKSAAADRFAALGAEVVDTDAIAHELTARGGAAIDAIRESFGAAVIDASGALDRAAMRALVFADAQARKRLEAILHPLIRAESRRRCSIATTPYVVLAVPLLIESGHWQQRCDRVCVIDCPEDEQVRRVVARSGLTEAQVRAIMASQASRASRLAAADDIVDNSADLAALHRRIDALHERYLAAANA